MLSFVAIMVLSLSAINVSAVTVSWLYEDDHQYGSYVPDTGTMYSAFSSAVPEAYTNVSFTFDERNVNAILNYNNGTHSEFLGIKGYVTVDVSSVRNGLTDKMDAYAITSNLPDPKYDLENDDILGSRNEESEVVALGTVEAKEYYVITGWNDLREGNANDGGRWQCQFSMSQKGVNDYNNLIQSPRVQAVVEYGNNFGED